MLYSTRHWVAKPGHEDALAAGLRKLVAVALTLAAAAYVGRDVAHRFPRRPSYVGHRGKRPR